MSLAVLANHMASKGRNGDSMLVHMSPEEVRGLQALAVMHGEKLTINPETGLPEAFSLKSLLPMIAGMALNAFLPGVGTAVSGALGITGAAAGAIGTGLTVGAVTGLASGSLQKGIMAGLGAYGGAGLAEGLANAGISSAAQEMATRAAGEAAGLGLEGQAAADFMQSRTMDAVAAQRALSPMEQLTSGFSAAKEAPIDFLKNNARTLLTASTPIMADAMVPTATPMPSTRPGDTGYVRSFQFNPYTQGLQYLGAVPANQIRPSPPVIPGAPTPAPAPAPAPYDQPPGGYNSGGIVALAAGGKTDKLTDAQQAYYTYLLSVPGEGKTDEIRDYVKQLNDTQSLGSLALRLGRNIYSSPELNKPDWPDGIPPGYAVRDYLNSILPQLQSEAKAAAARNVEYYRKEYGWEREGGIPGVTDVAAPAPAPAPAAAPAAAPAPAAGGQAQGTTPAQPARPTQPSMVDFMKATGADFNTTSDLFSGVLGSNYSYANDPRNWQAIMASNDPLAAARAATNAMYGGVKLGEVYDSQLKRSLPALMDASGKVLTTQVERAANFGLNIGAGGGTGGGAGGDKYLYTPEELARFTTVPTITSTSTSVPGGTVTGGTVTGGGVTTTPTSTAPTFTLGSDRLTTPTGTITGGTTTGGGTTGGSTATGPIRPVSVTSAATLPGYSGTDKTYGGLTTLNEQVNAALGTAGRVAAGTDTMQQVRDAYTRGGGSLGMPTITTPTPVMTGGSKQAYDYLMGQGAYPVSPYLPAGTQLMRPYTETIAESMRPSMPTITLPKRPERSTALSVANTTGGTNMQTAADLTGGTTVDTSALTTADMTGGSTIGTGLQTWQNQNTGELFYAPKGGYTPQGEGWKVVQKAGGGLADVAAAAAARGGNVQQYNLGGYSDGGRLLRGPGDGVSDSIPATIGNRQPARLADGEFVIPARIVSEIGNGSTEAGARKLYAMMDRVQRARAKTTGKGKVAKNTRADKYLPA